MAKDTVTDDLMTRYLLGDISDEERVRLEEHYFVDDGVFEQLSAFEDELIDDYVRGELAEPRRKQFELYFLNSAERRREARVCEILLSVPVELAHRHCTRKTGRVGAEDS